MLEAPPRYGADVVCGELQPLGVHMHYGGGLAGFVATSDEERWVAEYPTFLIGMTPTVVEGEYGFGEVAWERMSYVQRGDAKEYGGTTQNLWAIAVAVYLSLLGPQGIAELGRGCMQRARYAAARLSALPGVEAPALSGPVFKELVVSFDRHRQDRRRDQPAAAASTASTAARTSPVSSRSWARAPSTASPRCTRRPTSTDSSTTLAEVLG